MTLSINDINRLEQENARQKHEIKSLYEEKTALNKIIDKMEETLQEIKTLAEFEKIKDGTLIPIDEICTLYNDRNFRLMKIQEVINNR